MPKKILLILSGGLLSVAILITSGWVGLHYWYGNQPVSTTNNEEFTIVSGDSLGHVINRLTANKLIQHPVLFEILARVEGTASGLHVGEYLISPGTTYRQLLIKFVSGDIRYHSTTLVEGLTLREIIKDLNAHPKLTSPVKLKDISKAIKNTIEGTPKTDNLEGLFYADTYNFAAGTPVISILKRAHKRLEAVLSDEWQARSEGLPYKSPYQALIMASIIEKETGVPSERADIAGVFIRRLQKGMRLQTDPTVIYGVGSRYRGSISRRMLREPTAYNTYVIRGLPPTPIATVGWEAITAALNPAEGKTLYFVARGDGTHHFSNTLVEHNRAVMKYQITQRRKDYRSTVEE